MIGKVPRAGKGFKGLVKYLMLGGRNEPQPDRVSWTAVRNLVADDPELVSRLMGATAALSRRCRSPVYHYVISWHANERPTDEIMRKVADTTCADLGLDEHQLLYIAHSDTDHRHVHIVANRVHPETHKAWNRREDWVRIEKSLRRQSEDMGMDHVPGRHNDPERFRERNIPRKDREFQRVRRLEKEAPQWSEERMAKQREELAELFMASTRWDDLDGALAARGLRMERKGQGWVIAGEDGVMKLSSLGKDVRMKTLEARLGDRKARAEEKEKAEAYEAAANAAAETDLAYKLRGAGLVTRKQLERSIRDRQVAFDKLEAMRPVAERLADDVLKRSKDKDEEERRRKERERRRRDHDR